MEGGGSISKRVDRVGERFTNTKGEEFVNKVQKVFDLK